MKILFCVFILFCCDLAYSQTYYLVKNSNSKRKVKIDRAAYIEYEIPARDTSIKKLVSYIGGYIDSITETTIYLRKFHQVIETEYTDGSKMESNNFYNKPDYQVEGISYSYDSIHIADIILVSNYGWTNKSKIAQALLISTVVALGGVVLVGPFFLGSAYFSMVGVSFLASVPIFVTVGLVNNDFRFRSKKGKDYGLWHIEVVNN